MMKKIEYFLNLIHYGFYIFFKISERGIDPFTFNDEGQLLLLILLLLKFSLRK